KKGNRLFTQEDIKNLKLIYHLVKEKGYTLEGAKTKMKKSPKKSRDKQDLITRLESIKDELIKIKNQIS
uniref:MerR family transcriptional regulator n=1 Tax=Alteromonas abrolhosensis TaxID=1892904 RepID=UPI003BAD9A63